MAFPTLWFCSRTLPLLELREAELLEELPIGLATLSPEVLDWVAELLLWVAELLLWVAELLEEEALLLFWLAVLWEETGRNKAAHSKPQPILHNLNLFIFLQFHYTKSRLRDSLH